MNWLRSSSLRRTKPKFISTSLTFVTSSLVLDNYGATVLVDSERVDTASVGFTCGILRRQKADSQEDVEVLFNQILQ